MLKIIVKIKKKTYYYYRYKHKKNCVTDKILDLKINIFQLIEIFTIN